MDRDVSCYGTSMAEDRAQVSDMLRTVVVMASAGGDIACMRLNLSRPAVGLRLRLFTDNSKWTYRQP